MTLNYFLTSNSIQQDASKFLSSLPNNQLLFSVSYLHRHIIMTHSLSPIQYARITAYNTLIYHTTHTYTQKKL